MTNRLVPTAEAHVVDTNLFIEFERNNAIPLLKRLANEYNIVFLLGRVYEELTPENLPYRTLPVGTAIEDGWVRVIDALNYANPVVSDTMDTVRRYIAVTDNCPEHEIEQSDAEVGGAAGQLLDQDDAQSVAVYTSDMAAFEELNGRLRTTAMIGGCSSLLRATFPRTSKPATNLLSDLFDVATVDLGGGLRLHEFLQPVVRGGTVVLGERCAKHVDSAFELVNSTFDAVSHTATTRRRPTQRQTTITVRSTRSVTSSKPRTSMLKMMTTELGG